MIVLIVRRTYTNNVCKKMIGFKLPEYEMNQLIEKGIEDCSYSCLIKKYLQPKLKVFFIWN